MGVALPGRLREQANGLISTFLPLDSRSRGSKSIAINPGMAMQQLCMHTDSMACVQPGQHKFVLSELLRGKRQVSKAGKWTDE